MRRVGSLTVLLFVTLLTTAPAATADVPHQMHYQGHLTDSGGTPLDTMVTMTFTIYNDSSAGSLVLWTETQTGVEVNTGLFNVLLGSVTPIPDTVFVSDWTWLGIQIGYDPEIAPRTRLVTVPYAFRVATVDGSTGGVISGNVSIQSDLDLDGDLRVTGKATIGEYNTNTGWGAFVAGGNNSATGDSSAIGGGQMNVASQFCAAIGGGMLNTASGVLSSIGGGRDNQASGDGSTVSGGSSNIASDYGAAVGGGTGNAASGDRSTVSGGHSDTASGTYSTVGGGYGNAASNSNSTVGGGYENTSDGEGSTISGGQYNVANSAITCQRHSEHGKRRTV
jgi:hypothetical protein